MPSQRQIFRHSAVVGFFSFLGSVTGILVDTTIAAKLGLSRNSDTFYVAFTIPYIITNLVGATGQFSLVPFFASLEARHTPEEQSRGLSYALNIVFLGSSLLAVAGAAAALWVVRGVAPGFAPPETSRAAELGQWLFLIIIPAGVAEVFRSFLLSRHRFALASGSSLFRNVTIIAFIVLTFERWGPFSIVLGYLAGTLLQMLVLAAQTLVSFPFRYSLVLVGGGESARRLRGSGAAQIAAALGWQGVVVAERMIASFLPPGSLTALNYGLKIMSTISELLAGSVGTASLPALSKAAARGAVSEERATFRHALQIGEILVSPCMVFCLLLSRPIVRLIFERGNFTPEATTLMASVFFYYSLSLLCFSAMRVLNFYLFARHESGSFLRLSALQYGLTVALDFFYVFGLRVGPRGVPLALLTSLIVTLAAALRSNVAGLRRVLDRSLGVLSAKNLAGACAAALAVWTLSRWIAPPVTGLDNFLYLLKLCGAGAVLFLGALAALRAIRVSDIAALWQTTEEA